MQFTNYLLLAILAAFVTAAPVAKPNNDFDNGNIYTTYEDLEIGDAEPN